MLESTVQTDAAETQVESANGTVPLNLENEETVGADAQSDSGNRVPQPVLA